jgi:hypothetical protein
MLATGYLRAHTRESAGQRLANAKTTSTWPKPKYIYDHSLTVYSLSSRTALDIGIDLERLGYRLVSRVAELRIP